MDRLAVPSCRLAWQHGPLRHARHGSYPSGSANHRCDTTDLERPTRHAEGGHQSVFNAAWGICGFTSAPTHLYDPDARVRDKIETSTRNTARLGLLIEVVTFLKYVRTFRRGAEVSMYRRPGAA